MIECAVTVRHLPSVAAVEGRALPARPQPCSSDRFMAVVHADDHGRIGTAKGCSRQAAEPAADVEYDPAIADPTKIHDRLGQSLAPATHEVLIPACEVNHVA